MTLPLPVSHHFSPGGFDHERLQLVTPKYDVDINRDIVTEKGTALGQVHIPLSAMLTSIDYVVIGLIDYCYFNRDERCTFTECVDGP